MLEKAQNRHTPARGEIRDKGHLSPVYIPNCGWFKCTQRCKNFMFRYQPFFADILRHAAHNDRPIWIIRVMIPDDCRSSRLSNSNHFDNRLLYGLCRSEM